MYGSTPYCHSSVITSLGATVCNIVFSSSKSASSREIRLGSFGPDVKLILWDRCHSRSNRRSIQLKKMSREVSPALANPHSRCSRVSV